MGGAKIMLRLVVLVVQLLLCYISAVSADNFAVIVAGSSGFSNYRHQADACHAYHVVTNNGMKPENVILFMVDDVANSPMNPFRGQLFNAPTAPGVPGKDVYAGCKPSYTGDDVNV